MTHFDVPLAAPDSIWAAVQSHLPDRRTAYAYGAQIARQMLAEEAEPDTVRISSAGPDEIFTLPDMIAAAYLFPCEER